MLKITTTKKDLWAAIKAVQPAIEKRKKHAAQHKLKFTAYRGRCSIEFQGYDLFVKTWLAADCAGRGATFVIQKEDFHRSVQALDKGEVTLTHQKKGEENFAELRQGCGSVIFQNFADDFSCHTEKFTPNGKPVHLAINQDTRAALKRAIPFISHEETRYYLNGVSIRTFEEIVRIAATDGHRLMFEDINDWKANDVDQIIPRALVKILTTSKEDGVLDVFENLYASFKTSQTTTISRLIDGTFPQFERVVPQTETGTMTVDRNALIFATKMCLASHSERIVSVTCNVSKEKLTIHTKPSPDGGTNAHFELPCIGTFDDLNVGFNAKYLLELLKVQIGDNVEFKFGDRPEANAVKIIGSESPGMTLLMPMRV